MFDLIITDVDGTLLDSHKQLPDTIVKAVCQAHREGVLVTIASGRSKCSLDGILRALDVNIPHIGSCGAYIAAADGTILEHTPLTQEESATVVRSVYTERDAWGIIYQNIDRMIGDPKGYARMVQFIQENLVCEIDLLAEHIPPATKVDVMGQTEVLVCIRSQIEQYTPALTITSEKSSCMEITAHGISKGTGIIHLAGLLNIPAERIAVIGDGYNDVSMFQVAGLSIAMGNAPADVQAQASWIAPNNDHAGVAWAIAQILRMNSRQSHSPSLAIQGNL